MPHALFLGSSLATQDRVSLEPPRPDPPVLPSSLYAQPGRRTLRARVKSFVAPLFKVSRAERVAAARDYRTKYGERENNSLPFIRQHLGHGIADIVISLLGIAVPINSAILILAATVFFRGRSMDAPSASPAGLFDAYDLIEQYIGKAAAVVFALALICAGQAASITATLAGQIVSEGFIEWRISPFFRRLVTRLIGLVPSVIVAVAAGREGINTLLVASQVILSVVLPFIAFPLIYLTSSAVVMRVRVPSSSELSVDGAAKDSDCVLEKESETEKRTPVDVRVVSVPPESDDVGDHADASQAASPAQHPQTTLADAPTALSAVPLPAQIDAAPHEKPRLSSELASRQARPLVCRCDDADERVETSSAAPSTAESASLHEFLDFSNGWTLTIVAYAIWAVVLVANVYALVMVGMGKAV
ncbi:hypothetical protein HGRIS_007564 [Hohenbuehelia grisea]